MTLTPASAAERGKGKLPELLGLHFTVVEQGLTRAEMRIREQLLAPNGFLHAAAIVGLADTACGYGTIASLPPGADNFTTVELKSNFFSTARDGVVDVEARLVHGGRSTQVWDAEVSHRDSGKRMALFRCTQMILYPRTPG